MSRPRLIIASLILTLGLVAAIVARRHEPSRQVLEAQRTGETSINNQLIGEVQAMIRAADPIAYEQLDASVETATRQAFGEAITNLNQIIADIDRQVMTRTNERFNQLTIDKNQKDDVYINEFRLITANARELNPNLSDAPSLVQVGRRFNQIAEGLVALPASPRFANFHKFWVATLTARGFVFEALGANPNEQERFVLLKLLADTVAAEEKTLQALTRLNP